MDPKFVPTSKKLTWIFTIFFIAACIASVFIKAKYGIDTGGVLTQITTLEGIIIAAYFGKSGLEHYMEIKNTLTNIQLPAEQVINDEVEV